MELNLPIWLVIIMSVLVIGAALTGLLIVIRTIAIITRTWLAITRVESKLEQLDNLGSVLFEIARQFKNDSGSTLLDKIEELERVGRLQKEDASLMRAMLNNLRAEQTQLALYQQRQPATAFENMPHVTMTNISGSEVGQAAAGSGIRQERK